MSHTSISNSFNAEIVSAILTESLDTTDEYVIKSGVAVLCPPPTSLAFLWKLSPSLISNITRYLIYWYPIGGYSLRFYQTSNAGRNKVGFQGCGVTVIVFHFIHPGVHNRIIIYNFNRPEICIFQYFLNSYEFRTISSLVECQLHIDVLVVRISCKAIVCLLDVCTVEYFVELFLFFSSLSASSPLIFIVGLMLLSPANIPSSYFSWNSSWIASSNTLNLDLLASVHVSSYVIHCTNVRNTGMPLADRIQYIMSDPTWWDGPKNHPILVSPNLVSSLYQTWSYHPKSRYYKISGVSPVMTSSGVLHWSFPEWLYVNCIVFATKWYSYLHSFLGQYVLNTSWYHRFLNYLITPSAGFWFDLSLSNECPLIPYLLMLA